jgi:hypothetical protein
VTGFSLLLFLLDAVVVLAVNPNLLCAQATTAFVSLFLLSIRPLHVFVAGFVDFRDGS